eukprot:TRINITY_DN11988_c0_g2_i2.p1 TRINITY_DN11988_c0_g2~~TRINITY_DN11988_c0_g2_i2.p1  ORF type:complete len:508 (-),score=84.70 TRINITY_DN11988_c0_g2_i2:54-1577(-)
MAGKAILELGQAEKENGARDARASTGDFHTEREQQTHIVSRSKSDPFGVHVKYAMDQNPDCPFLRPWDEEETTGMTEMGMTNVVAELAEDVQKAQASEQEDKTTRVRILANILHRLQQVPALARASSYKRLFTSEEAAKEFSKSFETPWTVKLWYVAWPCVLFFFAFFFQSFMLHIATHFYIKYMGGEQGNGRLYDIIGTTVGEKLAPKEGGAIEIPLSLLDATAGIPLALCFIAFTLSWISGTFSIGGWNKTFIVASAMAVIKGVFDVVTILPDSMGWERCQQRLHEEGVDRLSRLHFMQDSFKAFFNLFLTELSPNRIRYCADMMVSGHTYFATLFCLAAYNQVKYNHVYFPGTTNKIVRILVAIVCFGCITLELVLVALSRFHYTVDMLSSLLLVLVLHDSISIDQLASDWSEGFFWRDPEHFVPSSSPLTQLWCYMKDTQCDDDSQKIVASQSLRLYNIRQYTGCAPWDVAQGHHPGLPRNEDSLQRHFDPARLLPATEADEQ